MSNEADKTARLRSPEFFEKYCSGKILDIGGGDSPITSTAQVFDRVLMDPAWSTQGLQRFAGDAQHILEYFEPGTFDCVYSSHCLEHMQVVPLVIKQWWELVKIGGYMIIVVPDEDLYEQEFWPSKFNHDHKATFTIEKRKSWSPVSINLKDLLASLTNSEIISIELQDDGYDYRLRKKKFPLFARKIWMYKYSTGLKWFIKYVLYKILYYPCYVLPEWKLGSVIDQTTGPALAQIQAIIRKTNTQN